MNTDPETMLIIEDNPQIVRLFTDMFRHSDLNLVFLSSFDLHRLPDFIDEYQPMSVMMDYMTIHDQYDVVVCSIPLHIPTVMLTPIEDRKFVTHVDYCIKKPFAPSQIYAIMNDITRHVHE